MCKHIWAGAAGRAGVNPAGTPLVREQARPQKMEITAELAANVKGGQAKAEGQAGEVV